VYVNEVKNLIENRKIMTDDGTIVKDTNKHFSDSLNNSGYRIPSHKMGARIFSEIKFPDGMTDSDIGKMARLSKVMVGKTNMLGYRKRGKIEAYTAEEIGGLVDLTKSRPARNFVNKMVKLHVMKKFENVGYYINPAYFMANGQRLSLDLFLLFKDDLKNIVPEWAMAEFLRQAKIKQV